MTRGQRPSGDLLPWTISAQFQDNDFPSLAGARIVRIATHPDYQRVLFQSYFHDIPLMIVKNTHTQ
jgi:N-acetyltransferase 10